MSEPETTFPDPVRVLRAAHRAAGEHRAGNARLQSVRDQARAEVADRAAQLLDYAAADGVDLADPTARAAAAWLLLAVGGAPNRDAAMQVAIAAVADAGPWPAEGDDDGEV